MTFLSQVTKLNRWGRCVGFGTALFGLAACAPTTPPLPQVDAATGQAIIEGGDIAIVGQQVAHSLLDLPQVADATTPPLVRFSGVTSAIAGPVDTTPYTGLLRDRLLLITRLKLRFVERVLPPLHSYKIKSQKDLPPDVQIDTNADYQVFAELRGAYDSDYYLVQVRFTDLHSNTDLFSGLYRIKKEIPDNGGTTVEDTPMQTPGNPAIESTAPNPDAQPYAQPPPPAAPPDGGGTIQ